MANAAGGEAINLNPGDTVVTLQTKNVLTNISDFAVTKQGGADADNLVEEGEVFTISVNLSTSDLAIKDSFIIQIKPPQGATVVIERSVPDRIQTVMALE